MTTASEEGVATEVTEQVAALKLGAGADDPAPAHDPPVAEVNDENFVRLFVGDLPRSCTEQSFRAHFQQWGPVSQCAVKHPTPRAGFEPTRSFGFVSVPSDIAQEIISATHVIDEHRVTTPEIAKPMRMERPSGEGRGGERSSTRGMPQVRNARDNWADRSNQSSGSTGAWSPNGMWQNVAPRKVFVGGLAHQTKEQALHEYFSQFGSLTDVVVMTEGSARRPRGFGFVYARPPRAASSTRARARSRPSRRCGPVACARSFRARPRSARRLLLLPPRARARQDV